MGNFLLTVSPNDSYFLSSIRNLLPHERHSKFRLVPKTIVILKLLQLGHLSGKISEILSVSFVLNLVNISKTSSSHISLAFSSAVPSKALVYSLAYLLHISCLPIYIPKHNVKIIRTHSRWRLKMGMVLKLFSESRIELKIYFKTPLRATLLPNSPSRGNK